MLSGKTILVLTDKGYEYIRESVKIFGQRRKVLNRHREVKKAENKKIYNSKYDAEPPLSVDDMPPIDYIPAYNSNI